MTKFHQNDLIRKGRNLRLKIYKEYLRGERAIVIENIGKDLMYPYQQLSYICLDYVTTLRAIRGLGGKNA